VVAETSAIGTPTATAAGSIPLRTRLDRPIVADPRHRDEPEAPAPRWAKAIVSTSRARTTRTRCHRSAIDAHDDRIVTLLCRQSSRKPRTTSWQGGAGDRARPSQSRPQPDSTRLPATACCHAKNRLRATTPMHERERHGDRVEYYVAAELDETHLAVSRNVARCACAGATSRYRIETRHAKHHEACSNGRRPRSER